MSDLLFDYAPQIDALAPGQWRLARIEICNWGTLSGLRIIPVPRKGLLITGESGSGKSTILDALTTVLMPDQHAKYNAAASGGTSGDTARSRLTYVRGAYAKEVDENTNEAKTVYLRPKVVAAGIALVFENGQNQNWTAVRLFHAASGASESSQLTNGFFSFDGDQPLAPLIDTIKDGNFIRKITQTFPHAKKSDTAKSFHAALIRKIGIGSETAANLLHKTLATKNVNSLDKLMREYMLEEPTTEASAKTAVEQFQNLKLAHEDVIKAKEQISLLTPLKKLIQERDNNLTTATEATRLKELLPAYRAELTRLKATKDKETHQAQLEEQKIHKETLENRIKNWETESERLNGLYLNQGGYALAEIERQITANQQQKTAIEAARADYQQRLQILGDKPVPNSISELQESSSRVKAEISGIDVEISQLRETANQLYAAQAQTTSQRREIETELKSLQLRRSALPTRLIEIREQLSTDLKIPEKDLPFAGELIDVTSPQWRGAIEKLLRPLAVSLLVPDAHANAVAAWINGRRLTDRNQQGVDFTYQRLPGTLPESAGKIKANTVITHLHISEHPYRGWLVNEIFKRFNYQCVNTPQELHKHTQAITAAGLIKGGSGHRKLDRYRIDDRSRWVLGSNNHDVVEALQQNLQTLAAKVKEYAQERDIKEKHIDDLQENKNTLERLLETKWEQIDLSEVTRRESELENQLNATKTNSNGLEKLRDEVAEIKTKLANARRESERIAQQIGLSQHQLTQAESALTQALAELNNTEFSSDDLSKLSELCRGDKRSLSKIEPQKAIETADKTLSQRIDTAKTRISEAEKKIQLIQVNYINQWAEYATNLTTDLDSYPDFLNRLSQLEADNLPRFEERFRTLLYDQTQNEISTLISEIKGYFRRVKRRIDPVNGSLSQTPYNLERKTYLRILPTHAPSLETRQFLKDLEEITAKQFNLEPETPAAIETRFKRIERIMEKLSSQERAMINWRAEVLDTRRHVTFRAEEYNQDNDIVDVYESSAGRSGGQSQKLVTFALAAALRYQLADSGSYVPRYGTVVLDEAFDKTDAQFARDSLEIFKNFGFQMILASPLKMNQTVEPYVGGVVQTRLNTDLHTQLAVSIYEEA